jgi:hypothetical protein
MTDLIDKLKGTGVPYVNASHAPTTCHAVAALACQFSGNYLAAGFTVPSLLSSLTHSNQASTSSPSPTTKPRNKAGSSMEAKAIPLLTPYTMGRFHLSHRSVCDVHRPCITLVRFCSGDWIASLHSFTVCSCHCSLQKSSVLPWTII